MRGAVIAIQCCGFRSSSVATSRTWVASRGIAVSGARRLRQAGAEPTSANPIPPAGSPLSLAHCTTTSPGSKRPAADTTSFVDAWQGDTQGKDFTARIVERWRRQAR